MKEAHLLHIAIPILNVVAMQLHPQTYEFTNCNAPCALTAMIFVGD
jgi:hypothetical protein